MPISIISADIEKQAAIIAHQKDVLILPFETRERLSEQIATAIARERDRHKQRKSMLRQIIVSAAPTCKLWIVSGNSCYLVFRFWPQWKISEVEIQEAKKGQ